MDLRLFLLFTVCRTLVISQDIVQRTFCWNQDFRLDCKWRSILAIHDAHFTNEPKEVNASSCQEAYADGDSLCTEDVKASVNKRCSGMSHCHYNMTADHRQRQCYCKGVIVLRYACVSESDLIQSCNTKALGQSGYISSPGYPRFYPKVQHCTWSIEESKNQKMMLTFLDMDTRPPTTRRSIDNCPDSVTIYEDFHKLRYSCGADSNETRKPVITSQKNVHMDFSSLDFMPSRGFLLYYKVHGCPTLPPPEKGYMVYRNDSSAMYMCCRDHVFDNTTTNMFHLECVNNMRWNRILPACVSTEEIDFIDSNSSKHLDEAKVDIVEIYMKRNKYIEEILIPTACVVGIIFGHVAAVVVLLKIRKKRKSSGTSQQNSLPQTSTHHQPEAIACISTAPRVPAVPPSIAPRVLITDL